jgi:translocation and assembly module TamB
MKKILIVLASLALLILIGFWGYLQTSHAHQKVLTYITETLKEKTGHEVQIESLSFPLPFTWIAHKIKVKENDHTWLTIDEVKMSILFWEWIQRDFNLRHLTLLNVHLNDLPQSKIKSPASDENTLWELFPYNAKVSSFKIINLSINPELLSNDESVLALFPLDLAGSFRYRADSQMARMDVSVQRHADLSGKSTNIRLLCQDSHFFAFHLDLLESKQGILSQALNLAFPEDLHIVMEGKKAPDKTYDGHFDIQFLSSSGHQLEGTFFYSRNGQLNIHSVNGTFGPAIAKGEILLNTTDFKIHEGSLHMEIADCSAFNAWLPKPIEGSLKANAAISGTLIHPTLNLKFSTHQVKVADEPIENLTGEATLLRSAGGLDGHAFVNFGLRQMRFKADSLFLWNEQKISLKSFQADYGNARLEGEINYLFENDIWDGKLEASAADSSVFQNFLDVNLHGSSALSIKLYGAGTSHPEQNMEFIVQADRARYHHFHVEKAVLSGRVRSVFQNPQADLSLKGKHAMYKGWRLSEFNAETSIDPTQNFWPFHIYTNESKENSLLAQAKGRWQLSPEKLHVHLELLRGEIKKHAFNLQNPISFYLQNESFDLSPLTLTIGEGSLYANIHYQHDKAEMTTRIHQVPLEIFYPSNFIMPFVGTLTAQADLSGTPGELTGQVEAQLSHIKIFEETFAHTAPFDAHLTGKIDHSHMTCSAQIVGVTPLPIIINAQLPIAASLNPPSLYIDEQAPLTAHLTAQGEIAPLLQLLIIDSSSLSGKTSVELDVSGTFHDPHVTGNISIANGSFESLNTGALFHDLNAHLEAHDKVLVLKKFKALDINDGIIQGQGQLELQRDQGFPFTLNLQLSRIRLLNLDFIKAIGSGDVVITGNSRMGKIQGHLVTDSIEATIPEQAPALAHSLDVKYINLRKGEVSSVFITSRPSWPLEMDLQIDVQKNATIKSKDLSSYWHGKIKVEGMSHAPQFFGDFKIIKGEYHFNGQKFDIKEGTISLAGDADKKTTLYVIATKDLGKIVAEVILKGPVKNPLMSFRSNPPLSQREILSWILFGRGTTDITPFQGAELSQSFSDLTKNTKKEPDVLTKIRDRIGIDRIDINKTDGNESNAVSVQVGKYISRGVFVKVNKSITSEANQVGIEANLWPNIKAEAQVGDDSSTQLQLKWKRDY